VRIWCDPREGFTHDNWWQANSYAGLTKVLEAFHKGGGSSSPLLVSSTKHWSQVYVSRFYNWKAGSWKGAYEYRRAYKLKPDADASGGIPALSSFWCRCSRSCSPTAQSSSTRSTGIWSTAPSRRVK
jgi:hypothetical protein